MKPSELRSLLEAFGLSQANFARLLGVTGRAVNLWLMEERAIPGAVVAYCRLLNALPANLRQIEFGRLNDRGTTMRDGMFGITFQGQTGSGMGLLIFDTGRVYGTDSTGAQYDGGYTFDEGSAMANLTVKVRFPANVMSVVGISNPYEWAIDVSTIINPKLDIGSVVVKTSVGPTINAQYKYLRGLPEASEAR